MNERPHLSRRDFLRFSAMSAVGLVAMACGQPEHVAPDLTPFFSSAATPIRLRVAEYKEPPSLAAKVEARELPPISERLPLEPLVVKPFNELGEYGGVLRMLDASEFANLVGPMQALDDACYERLARWNQQVTALEPNILLAWDVQNDGQAYTLYLRNGMKWSDGEPCTADDLMFFFEDVVQNDQFVPRGYMSTYMGADPTKIEKIDSTTVHIRFSAPNVFFLHLLSSIDWAILPRHYLEAFHPSYASEDALQEAAKGYDWLRGANMLFQLKANMFAWGNPDCPTLRAWRLTNSAPAEILTYERNPYYWKVDTEGNQLPYIDSAQVTWTANEADIESRAENGFCDLQQRFLSFEGYQALLKSEEKGEYRTFLWDNPTGANVALYINQNSSNATLRGLLQDKRLRVALSAAINRDEMNQVLYDGMGVPRQATIASTSPLFKTEYATANAAYDPEAANKLLDQAGLSQRDVKGFRMAPNGEVLALTVSTDDEERSTQRYLDMIKDYWETVGLRTTVQVLGNYGYGGLAAGISGGTVGISAGSFDYSYYPYSPTNLVPISENTAWAPSYGLWYRTGGKEGDEPPTEIKKLQSIWDEIKTTLSETKQIELFQQILDLHAANCWIIGAIGEVPNVVIASSRLHNMPQRALSSPDYTGYLGAARVEQLWFGPE